MVADYRRSATRRAILAGLVGVAAVAVFGGELAVPALALTALVYYAHQLAAVVLWDAEVPHPDLAFVIAVNSLVVLAVQGLVVLESLRAA